MKTLCRSVCLSPYFEKVVIACVFLNAMTIGIEVSLETHSPLVPIFSMIDHLFLVFFTLELLLKIYVYRQHFFEDSWRVFDFLVVIAALIPTGGRLSILRAFRILRALRVVSVVPRLRQVVHGLMNSVPGLGAVGGILILVFYIASVMATSMFGDTFQEWFGTIPKSAYSLFQVMTLESWSMGIVRPVMERYSWAWLFFVPFIIVTTFIMLNLMIAVIVNSMQVETNESVEKRAEESRSERKELLQEIRSLQEIVLENRNPSAFSGITVQIRKKDMGSNMEI